MAIYVIFKRALRVFPLVLVLLLSSGCAIWIGDSLLAAPRLPEEYGLLQNRLDEIASGGTAFQVTAEVGSNRQSVQLKDLDGDGGDEAIAFFRTANSDIVAYIFRRTDTGYVDMGRLTGYGSLRAVLYPRHQKGSLAIAASWGQDGSYGMTIAAADGENGMKTLLQDTQYSQMTVYDIENDSIDELIFIRRVGGATPEEQRYILSIFGIVEGVYKEISSIELCKEVKTVSNFSFTRGSQKGTVYIYVDSQAASTGSYVTDVIYYDGRKAVNLSIDLASGEGSLKRSQSVFSADINGDGIIDIPISDRNELPDESAAARETRANKLLWMNLGSGGDYSTVAVTYHNVADRWFIFWPEDWSDRVYAFSDKSAYAQSTRFYIPVEESEPYYVTEEEPEHEVQQTLLYIYAFSGDERVMHSKMFNLTRLRSTTAEYIYGYRIPAGANGSLFPSSDEVEDMFRTIDKSWRNDIF